MTLSTFFLYLLIMAGSTYLIRVLPFVAVRHKIENRFIRSFLYYIPYAVLTAMTIPAIFTATASVISACAGLAVAVLLALKKCSLTTVALAACLAVYLTELVISWF
jgi:branched-subunit amino acid transport protein